jgi:hypothetical protein
VVSILAVVVRHVNSIDEKVFVLEYNGTTATVPSIVQTVTIPDTPTFTNISVR